jgi:hypothetical protein
VRAFSSLGDDRTLHTRQGRQREMAYPENEIRPSVQGIPPAYPLYNPFFKMETACSLCYEINTHLYMLQSPATIYLLFIFGFTKTVINKDMLMLFLPNAFGIGNLSEKREGLGISFNDSKYRECSLTNDRLSISASPCKFSIYSHYIAHYYQSQGRPITVLLLSFPCFTANAPIYEKTIL